MGSKSWLLSEHLAACSCLVITTNLSEYHHITLWGVRWGIKFQDEYLANFSIPVGMCFVFCRHFYKPQLRPIALQERTARVSEFLRTICKLHCRKILVNQKAKKGNTLTVLLYICSYFPKIIFKQKFFDFLKTISLSVILVSKLFKKFYNPNNKINCETLFLYYSIYLH
jgi:hypothetical protein